jgi:nucleotide-binding universal stress UspA family protein
MMLLNVIEDTVTYDKFPTDPGFLIRREKAEKILNRAKEIVKEVSQDIELETQLAHGPVSSNIVRIAEVGGYDGIFIGTKGTTGIKRMLVGDVADDAIRHAHCPVTVVR